MGNWIDERTQHQKRAYSPSRALNLFRQGMDTVDIAAQMSVTEAQAVELLEEARKRE